jgi:poly(3-hydroxybutyrate) depolymerase
MLLVCLVALCASPIARAGDSDSDKDRPDALKEGTGDANSKTGAFQIKIPERCKDSAIPSIIARLGWGTMESVKQSHAEQDYNLADETFEVYVPADYTGKEPYGLFVWVNPGPDGKVHGSWAKVLDKHKLIWVGANNSGNNRSGWIRMGLALDAVNYMPTKYNIDKNRVYVSGASGGGRCSSMLGVAYPEYFTGGSYPIIGCNFYRRVEVSAGGVGKGAEFYPQSFKRPAAKLWDAVTKERRHAYLTGDNDPNRQQTELNYKAAKKDGFKHITYIQVPGMGHQPPDAEWFEKGIVALDEGTQAIADAGAGGKESKPAEKAAARADAKPVVAAKATTKVPSAPTPKAAAPPSRVDAPEAAPSPTEEADKLLKLARLYVDNRLYNKAREKLKQLVKEHPKTPQAAEAEKLLKEIGNG